ncbi:MAG: hypothetical protein GX940_11030 [Clostridiaceae bacterium]|nr:hypothetical protein [Clostridiaceae bacterium]
MKRYIMKGLKILYAYAMAVLVFVVFLYPFMGITKEAFNTWLPFYSILTFLFLFTAVYFELKELAINEKKPHSEVAPYPLKGLVYGLVSVIPVTVITAVFSFIRFEDPIVDRLRHLGVNTFLGPLYFFIRWFNEAILSYFGAILLIPVIAAFGYLVGYYGINLSIREKLAGKKPVQEKGFTKSPWNPTLNEKKPPKKKKKKNVNKGQ